MNRFAFTDRENGLTKEMFRSAALYLEGEGVKWFGSSLRELTRTALGVESPASELLIRDSIAAGSAALSSLEDGINRLAGGEPVQYITGTAPFFGHDFYVDSRVLIPRFDTETLVETALPFLNDGDSLLDLCSGSGCIGIAAAAERNLRLTAADISVGAGEVFKVNAESILTDSYYKKNPPRFVRADVFAAKDTCAALGNGYDMIISNPPYVTADEMKRLPTDVLAEPGLALFGGNDGLEFYRRIPPLAAGLLKDGGMLLFECGRGQYSAVMNIMKENGYTSPEVIKDDNGIERVVYACLRNKQVGIQATHTPHRKENFTNGR